MHLLMKGTDMWDFLVRTQRKLIRATRMRRGGTLLVALVEAILAGLVLWFAQAKMPFPWYGDFLIIICVPAGLIAIIHRRRLALEEESGSLDVVTDALREEDGSEEMIDTRPWVPAGPEVDTVPIDMDVELGKPVKRRPPIFVNFGRGFAFVACLLVGLGAYSALGNLTWLPDQWRFALSFFALGLAAFAGFFLLLPTIDRGGVIEIKPISPSTFTVKYMGRIKNELVYFDRVRHWMYLVNRLTGAETLGTALFLTASMVYIEYQAIVPWPLLAAASTALVYLRLRYCIKKWRKWVKQTLEDVPNYHITSGDRWEFLLAPIVAPFTEALALPGVLAIYYARDNHIEWWPWAAVAVFIFAMRVWFCWVKWHYIRLVLTTYELTIVDTFPLRFRRKNSSLEVRSIQVTEPKWTLVGAKMNYGHLVADTAASRDQSFHDLVYIPDLHILKACTKMLTHGG